MSIRRITLAGGAVIAVAGVFALAAFAAAVVPHGSAGAINAAFAHGPGPWKVPVDPQTGNSKYSAWPNACQMLNLAELKALVPGTVSVKGQGQHGDILGGGETPKFVLCKFNLKGSYDPPASDGYPPSWIQVEIRGVMNAAGNKSEWTMMESQQAKIAKKYPDQFGLYKGPHGTQCFWDGSSLECIAGTWNFWISGQFIDKTGSDTTALQKAFRTSVLLPAAYGLASRMH